MKLSAFGAPAPAMATAFCVASIPMPNWPTAAGAPSSLAGRFAAKEAVAKALGTGIWRHDITWTDIEVRRDPASGAPVLTLHNAAAAYAQQLGLDEWSLSLSHDRSRVVAFVVALG